MSTSQQPATMTVKPKGTPRGKLWTLIVIAVLAIAGGTVGAYHYNAEGEKDSQARTAAAQVAFQQVNQLSHGAITPEDSGYITRWGGGKLDQEFRVGSCHHVSGYVKMSKRPAPNGAEVHILVPSVNPKAADADMKVTNVMTYFTFTLVLNSKNSALLQCVAGDERLVNRNAS